MAIYNGVDNTFKAVPENIIRAEKSPSNILLKRVILTSESDTGQSVKVNPNR